MTPESIFILVLVIIAIGFAVYLIDKVKIDQTYKDIAKAVLIFALIVYLLFWVAGLLGIVTPHALR